MLDEKELRSLAIATAKANTSSKVAYSFGEEKFSASDLNETLRKELNELAGTYQLYRRNQNTIFELIENVISDVLPERVLEQYGQFAEVKTYSQGEKPVFTNKVTAASKRRAKQFITKVGLAGVYEVFKLEGKTYEIPMTAFGGAAQIGFEEFLDGRVDFADLIEVIMEGLDEAIYLEIEKALIASIADLPGANYHTDTAFDETEMDKLVSIADSYGKATIYCTYEFAATMLPATGWVSDKMRDDKWANGYLANYKGHNVVVLRQSYTDETNSKKVIDPAYAWIIPTGAEKPVKVAMEGETAVREEQNKDWSREIQAYKKLGVGTIITNNICVYYNKDLKK